MAQESLACPHCQAAHVSAGARVGDSTLSVLDCHRTFNALTGSPLAGLKCREAWVDYTKAMIDGCSLAWPPTAQVFSEYGIRVGGRPRSRHRVHNIVEADETYFLESFKGQRKRRPARHRGVLRQTRPVGRANSGAGRRGSGRAPLRCGGSQAVCPRSLACCPRLAPDALLCRMAPASLRAGA